MGASRMCYKNNYYRRKCGNEENLYFFKIKFKTNEFNDLTEKKHKRIIKNSKGNIKLFVLLFSVLAIFYYI